MYGTTNGVVGSNITFSWSGTGGYYQVVNAAGSHRAYTTGTSLTIPREAGSTCGRVRAARSAAHASAGVWSGWSGLVCGTTTNPAPSAPAWVSLSGGHLASIWLNWASSTYATSYQARIDYQNTTGGWVIGAVQYTTTTSVVHNVPGTGGQVMRGRVWAVNSSGTSPYAQAGPWTVPN